jgi:tRNA(Ile)-lysidine synthase TilS/MesJ
MGGKSYLQCNVLEASRERIRQTFDAVERVYIAFSGGKDSSVMFHLVMEEARRRNVRVGVMYIDMEAQYADTIKHVKEMLHMYQDHIDPHWICRIEQGLPTDRTELLLKVRQCAEVTHGDCLSSLLVKAYSLRNSKEEDCFPTFFGIT